MASIPMSRFEKRMIVIPKLKALGLEVDDKTSWYEITQICEGNDINIASLLKHPVPIQPITTAPVKPMGFTGTTTNPEPIAEPIIAEDEQEESENEPVETQEQPQDQAQEIKDNPEPADDEEYLV